MALRAFLLLERHSAGLNLVQRESGNFLVQVCGQACHPLRKGREQLAGDDQRVAVRQHCRTRSECAQDSIATQSGRTVLDEGFAEGDIGARQRSAQQFAVLLNLRLLLAQRGHRVELIHAVRHGPREGCADGKTQLSLSSLVHRSRSQVASTKTRKR